MECLIQIQPSIITLQYHFCLEWLLNNAFTLTTYYLWYIVSHCCFSLLEYYEQRICVTLLTIMIIDAKLLCFIHVYHLTWNGLYMCSKLWSKCLPFRASLSAILSAFSWHYCLVGLSVYSYPGLEAHVCDGLSGWKNTYHASITYYSWFVGFGFWTLVLSVCIHGSIGHWFIVLVHRVGLWPLLLTFAL